jgi:hypothetical protein
MMVRSLRVRISAFALVALSSGGPVLAEEGMWLPSQAREIGKDLRAAGLKLDPAALADLQGAPLNAIVSLGDCSAAFVSPEGLVATNHHCVYGSVQFNSKPGRDYITDGFLARTAADELPGEPRSRVYAIEALTDVTEAMTRGLTQGMPGAERFSRLDANRKALISACEKQPNRRCDVRAYFGGATYLLQRQLEIQDVRLVYAPAVGLGDFGGETDNWMWPRHTGDFGFYRAYVAPDGSSAPYAKNNVPYRPKAWLKVAKEGVAEGDFVMVAGFPGSTARLATASEAAFNYASYAPFRQKLLADQSEEIIRATAGDEAAQIAYASILKGADNYKKKILGEIAGADAIDLNARKKADEDAYRAWIGADPARQARLGAAATALDAVIADNQAAAIDGLKLATINRATLLAAARDMYRWAKEREKPDAVRESGFQDRDLAARREALRGIDKRFVPKVDRALLEQALPILRSVDKARRPAAFEAKLATIGLDRLYRDTRLTDQATRLGWLDKPAKAFEASTDPFIQLAVTLYPWDIEREAQAHERSGRDQVARAVYTGGMRDWAKSRGKTLYPDANGSLRFTYGHVAGRTRDGQIWTPFTTAEGLLAKNTGKGEFDAPDRLIAAIRAKDYGTYRVAKLGTLPVDFMSTVDITNGNSGSSVLNARGEFVGLAFDGTLDGVIADWFYDASINRTIQVDSRFMLWTMDRVDGAARLLSEMGISPMAGPAR